MDIIFILGMGFACRIIVGLIELVNTYFHIKKGW